MSVTSIHLENHMWDLDKEKYHVMLAQGSARDGQIEKHRARIVSGVKRGLGEVGLIKARLVTEQCVSVRAGITVCFQIKTLYHPSWIIYDCCLGVQCQSRNYDCKVEKLLFYFIVGVQSNLSQYLIKHISWLKGGTELNILFFLCSCYIS